MSDSSGDPSGPSCGVPAGEGPGAPSVIETPRPESPADGRPLMIWDGDCGFCRRWTLHWHALTGDRVAYETYQTAAPRHPEIPAANFQRAVHLIEPGGRVSRGADAVMRVLALVPSRRWLWWIYRWVPGAAPLMELAYRWIAAHRDFAGRVTAILWGRQIGPPDHRLTRWIFLRLLGFTYLAAFFSLSVQIHGLVGAHGILPAGEYLTAAHSFLGARARWLIPTLCWFSAGDAILTSLSLGGAVLAVFLIIGVAQAPLLILLWVFYLSLCAVGQVFLSFQWDALLLEAGALAVLFAPWHLLPRRPARDAPPSLIALWLLRWLVFRLMFSSGVVKMTSGDPTWRHLEAMRFHYWTQPIPDAVSWYMANLPAWFHSLETLFMFAVELGAPFLIFTPRRSRALGFWLIVALQVLIAITGNYGFFNLLAITLAITLLDDGMWPRRLVRQLSIGPRSNARTLERSRALVLAPVGGLLFLLSLIPLASVFTLRMSGPAPLLAICRATQPFDLVNRYGLFARMTTYRFEISVEGSADGIEWTPYAFRYKPGDPMRRPRFFEPHMPRLDWQMWFAALDAVEDRRISPWLAELCQRLLEGSPEVLALFESDPFPDSPPRFIRLVLWNYHFTTPAEAADSGGAWWRRERVGVIYGPISRPGTRNTPPPGMSLALAGELVQDRSEAKEVRRDEARDSS